MKATTRLKRITVLGLTAFVLGLVSPNDANAQSASLMNAPGGVSFVANASVPGSATAEFRAWIRYEDAPPLDVTDSAIWDFETPPGLVAGLDDPANVLAAA